MLGVKRNPEKPYPPKSPVCKTANKKPPLGFFPPFSEKAKESWGGGPRGDDKEEIKIRPQKPPQNPQKKGCVIKFEKILGVKQRNLPNKPRKNHNEKAKLKEGKKNFFFCPFWGVNAPPKKEKKRMVWAPKGRLGQFAP